MKSLRFALLAVLLCFLACNKNSTDLNFNISVPSYVVFSPNQFVSCKIISEDGPLATDLILLSRIEGNEEYTCKIASLGKHSFNFVLPSQMVYGKYRASIKRGGSIKEIGTIEISSPEEEIPEDVDIDLLPGVTVYGKVSCNGVGLEGVVVSDGIEVAATDGDGVYQLVSRKKNNYVFVSVPSGYEVASNGVLPAIKKNLKKEAGEVECVNFEVFPAGDQTNHTMLYFGDMHLANRTNDRTQFKSFTSEINSYLLEHPSDKVYAITLGDMTWDLYWYSNVYGFQQYLNDINAISNLQIFHTIGNHDHDMKTSVDGNAKGWDAVDFDTGLKFRASLAPSNYSFNIGDVHYIVMDNIYCKNTPGGNSGNRFYDEKFSNEALEWLRKDLSFVSHDTPIVATMHSPIYTKWGSNYTSNTPDFENCLKDFESVTVVSGHTHNVMNLKKNNITEHNSGAICAAWWWSGKYYPTLNIADDGSPNGYRIMTVNGKKMTSFFKGIGRPDDYQFRSYDRNKIAISSASCSVNIPQNSDNFTSALKKYGGYNEKKSDNEVLLNIWDWSDGWKLSVKENGEELSWTQLYGYDPLYMITYVGPRFAESSSITWTPEASNHIFSVKASSPTSTLVITVTDDEGRIYTETMTRPKEFSINNYK